MDGTGSFVPPSTHEATLARVLPEAKLPSSLLVSSSCAARQDRFRTSITLRVLVGKLVTPLVLRAIARTEVSAENDDQIRVGVRTFEHSERLFGERTRIDPSGVRRDRSGDSFQGDLTGARQVAAVEIEMA